MDKSSSPYETPRFADPGFSDGAMDFRRPSRSLSGSLVAGRGHHEIVIGAVRQAKSSVWIATANVKDLQVEVGRIGRRASYASIAEILGDLARSGVDLRVLHAGWPSQAFRDSFDAEPTLVDGGLELRWCPRVHFNAIIVDAARVYLGSANWTGAGLGAKGNHRRNFELGIWSGDAQLIDEVQAFYDHIWRGRACGECKLRGRCEEPLDQVEGDSE